MKRSSFIRFTRDFNFPLKLNQLNTVYNKAFEKKPINQRQEKIFEQGLAFFDFAIACGLCFDTFKQNEIQKLQKELKLKRIKD